MTHPWFQGAPFRTASSFSSPKLIGLVLRGHGGKWLDYERRFIDRIQSQGIVGRRVPCESTYWDDRDDNPENDHPFFNADRATSLRTWDYNALRRGDRPGLNPNAPALTVWMQKHLLIQIGLAREFGIKTEFVIDWTLKHSPGVGWKVIGQCIRQTAAFLRLVHTGQWDKGVDGNAIGHPTNPTADAKIHEMFDAVKGPMDALVAFELHNEFDAHSQASWAKDGLSEAQALGEVNKQLERTKRIKDGVPEQWPEGACWTSQGGQDDIDYDPKFADAIAIHPSRPSTRVGDRFHHLRKYGKQIYANEILHYIDPSMWYLIENGTFRQGSSTKNTRDRMRFVDEMLDDGICVCEHSLTNMANGRWKDADQDYSEMPLDRYELARGATLNGNVNPPTPPDPPDPPDPSPPEPPMTDLFKGKLENRRRGRTIVALMPTGLFPVLLTGGSEDNITVDLGVPPLGATANNPGVLRARWFVDFDRLTHIKRWWAFAAAEPGDIWEGTISCYARGGDENGSWLSAPVAPHKEDPFALYDGYGSNQRDVDLKVTGISIHVQLRVNGITHNPARKGELTARPHVGVYFERG